MSEQSTDGPTDPPSQETSDELDPELIALPRPRTRVGALLVLSVVVLSTYLIFLLRSDFAYYFSNDTPKELGAATANMATLPDNELVAIQSMPDRSAPLGIEDKSWNRLMPFLGTSRRVWLRAVGEMRDEDPPYDERYVGRLRRLDDSDLAGALRRRLDERPPMARYLDPHALLKGPPRRDLAGDEITILPTTLAQIDETVRGVARVIIYTGDSYPDENKAAAALLAAGLVDDAARKPIASDGKSWTFEVPAPDGIAAVRLNVVSARLYAATVHTKLARHKLPFSQILARPGGLTVRGVVVPYESINRLAVFVKLQVADDAYVLLENETPEQFWYVPFVYGGLLLASFWLVFAGVRSARDHVKSEPDAPDNAGQPEPKDSGTATV